MLRLYYKEVEKNFKTHFEVLVKKFAPFDEEKIGMLKEELNHLNIVISKLDKDFGETLRWSLAKYATHVKDSEHVFVDSFIFPFLIRGFTESY